MPKPATTLDHYEVWFLTGSQHLYGEETLRQVADQSQRGRRHPGCRDRHAGTHRLEAGADRRRLHPPGRSRRERATTP